MDDDIISAYEQQMLYGDFNPTEAINQVGGWITRDGAYYLGGGHHKMAAAIRIFNREGDSSFIKMLIEHGRWTPAETAPQDSASLLKSASWLDKILSLVGLN